MKTTKNHAHRSGVGSAVQSETKYLTLTQAAALCGVSTYTVQRWIKAGRIKAVYSGATKQRARYVTRGEVNRILKGGV